jgi:hypothetical protein
MRAPWNNGNQHVQGMGMVQCAVTQLAIVSTDQAERQTIQD